MIGGGDTALEEASYYKLCSKVYLVHRDHSEDPQAMQDKDKCLTLVLFKLCLKEILGEQKGSLSVNGIY